MKSFLNFLKRVFFGSDSDNKKEIVLTEEQKEKIRKRGNCPFHGFMLLPGGFFVDSAGNGCGPSGEMRPCGMGVADWSNCSWNIPENMEILSKTTIFPDELKLSRDISVPEWIKMFKEVRNSST
ncbi:MAG: hypothetical protein PHH83_00290 [Patescibacteria group bacterium]|nr:hypothetical protein [Patescibacteria group bacterium]